MQTQGRISDGETLSAEDGKHNKRNKDEAFSCRSLPYSHEQIPFGVCFDQKL